MYRSVSFRLVPRALPDIPGSALYIVILPDRHHRSGIVVVFYVGFLGSPHFLAFHREFAQRLNDSEKNLYNFLSLVDFPLQNTSKTM